jgi:acetyl esterase
MRRLILFSLALALLPVLRAPAAAQMSNMPGDLRMRLAEINPTWGKDILGAGIAGVVLMSGRYHFDPKPDDPNLSSFQAYFGTDQTRYSAQSPINYVKAAKPMPTFIVISEYDNPDLDTQGALLFGALCERDRACPRFTRMELHNHLSMVYQFNTADDALGRQILDFIRRGR